MRARPHGPEQSPTEEQLCSVNSFLFSPVQLLSDTSLKQVANYKSLQPAPCLLLCVSRWILRSRNPLHFLLCFFSLKKKNTHKKPPAHTVQLNLTDVCSFTTKSWIQDGATCLVLKQKPLYDIATKSRTGARRRKQKNNKR